MASEDSEYSAQVLWTTFIVLVVFFLVHDIHCMEESSPAILLNIFFFAFSGSHKVIQVWNFRFFW